MAENTLTCPACENADMNEFELHSPLTMIRDIDVIDGFLLADYDTEELAEPDHTKARLMCLKCGTLFRPPSWIKSISICELTWIRNRPSEMDQIREDYKKLLKKTGLAKKKKQIKRLESRYTTMKKEFARNYGKKVSGRSKLPKGACGKKSFVCSDEELICGRKKGHKGRHQDGDVCFGDD